MPHTRVFTIEGASVSDGSSESLTDSDNDSWRIVKVQVNEESATTLDASTATISVAGDQVTDQNVPVSFLQESHSDLPEWNLDWPSNRQFEFDWTNNSGASATINVSLWVEPMSGGGQ